MDTDFELDLTLPTAQEAADFAVLVHDLEAKFAAIRPVPPQWDDDEDYACTERTLPLAQAVADVLLALTAAGTPDEADCRHLAELLVALVPELEDRDLLSDPVKLVRVGLELAREAVLDGYGAVAVLADQQETLDALCAALDGPHQALADLRPIHKAITHLLLGRQALLRLERFVEQQPLLQMAPADLRDPDMRLELRKMQALFTGMIRRSREDLGIEAD